MVVFFNKPSDISHLKVFGCKVYFLDNHKSYKADPNSKPGIFLGHCYSDDSVTYRVLDFNTKNIVSVYDVYFDEDIPESFNTPFYNDKFVMSIYDNHHAVEREATTSDISNNQSKNNNNNMDDNNNNKDNNSESMYININKDNQTQVNLPNDNKIHQPNTQNSNNEKPVETPVMPNTNSETHSKRKRSHNDEKMKIIIIILTIKILIDLLIINVMNT